MEVQPAPPVYDQDKIAPRNDEPQYEEDGMAKSGEVHDAFGNEEYAEIKYKTLKWWYVTSVSSATRNEPVLTHDFLGNVACS
jgi:hypothetical protein